VITVQGRLESSTISYSEPGYSRTQLHNRSGGLVPQYHRIDIGGAANSPFRIGVQVRSADTYCTNLDLNFTWPRIFDWHFRLAECPLCDELRGFHALRLYAEQYSI
jgi:hypothetical protein